MAEYKDELLDHEYDGIQEMDNNLPRWWVYGFIISIIWAVLYFAYYHVFGVGYSQVDQYMKEMDPDYVRVSEADMKVLGVLPEYHSPFFNPYTDITPRMKMASSREGKIVFMTATTDTTTYIAFTDPSAIADGKQSFIKNCAQCHGQLGEGGVGPNLTDGYWLHGSDFSSLVKSVKYGYPAKGMISWLGMLKEDDIIKTASFVLTLHGTDPPNAKGPQGNLVTE